MVKCPRCETVNPSDSKFCKECAAPLPPSADASASFTETIELKADDLHSGSIFAGRFQIIEELGSGGMGKVYRAVDRKLDEELALKLIKLDIASNKETLERFSRELKIARKIAHKNVGRMYELMEEGGTHFITMEFVPGQDLRKLIKQTGKLATETAVSIAKQVCAGLSEAHNLGIVHRDLKPSNIMIDQDGQARIMDFGIARFLKGKGTTRAGAIIGTPEYMSPEQVEGRNVDVRSDIYSLGVILYEMVTGGSPFQGDSSLAIAVKHKTEEPENPQTLNPRIPQELSQLILKCLEKDAGKRYQSAAELGLDLEKIGGILATGTGTSPPKKVRLHKGWDTERRARMLLIPVIIGLCLLAVVLLIWKPLAKKPPSPPSPGNSSLAVLPFEDLSPGKDQGYFCEGLAESLINVLSHIRGLRVPAKMSSFSFQGKTRDLGEIGRRLGVENILEGSLQKSGKRLRITARLSRVSDSSLLWSEQYDREMTDVFSIQDDIGTSIAHKLEFDLVGGEKTELLKHSTENSEAFDLYLRGRYLGEKRTEETLQKGLGYVQQAIAKDPKFALAYTALSDIYYNLGWYNFIPREEAIRKSVNAANKAVELDRTLCEGWVCLAGIKMLLWDWEGARKGFQQALELNPSNAEAHHQYAHFLEALGDSAESVSEIRKALDLEPLSVGINTCTGQVMFHARDYDSAIVQLNKALEMDPTYFDPYGWLGRAYWEKGLRNEAITMFNKAEAFPSIQARMTGCLGYAYGVEGDRKKALNELEKVNALAKEKNVDPCFIAWIYVGLGDKNSAFACLNKALLDKMSWLTYFKVDPFFDDLKTDPRYPALLKKIGLAD